LGANSDNKFINKVANLGNGVGSNSQTLQQIQAQQGNTIYNAAWKQGLKMNLGDAV
jgi:hypothetical protein